ncbi:hypothetical protein MFLO_04425 [Listeria floridensis FSL S10-1187]|uniref:HutD-family protein n=1 Tax=Listeria floridensis FSL S10-1187 TaxID=1265817 RepID=A0ABN0RGW4_9LIST|nr:HutD family protein [Listeria floridensis]EUJ33154.1 hypothetical protein MFLO_04425 [Listeria floridensis FSL S10-1187]
MYTVLDQKNYKTIEWSGGDSIEILIFPHDRSFQNKDFDLRISRTKLYQKESRFTDLPGYTRDLISLHGNVTLHHFEGTTERTVKMSPFKLDHFNGSAKTKSLGSGEDFNFIYRSGLEASIEILHHNQTKNFLIEPYSFQLIHVISDLIEIQIEPENDYLSDELVLKKGDSLLVFNETAKFSFRNASIASNSELAILCTFDTLHNRENYQSFINNIQSNYSH